jgi:ferredoxin
VGERIQVDPHLCQGGGSCATACPSGAITYAYPRPGDQIDRLRAMLRSFGEAGGDAAVVLFHDGEGGHDWLERNGADLPEQVLPVAVEEVGSVGMESWLSALAFGAVAVRLLTGEATPRSVRAELSAQMEVAAAILEACGVADGAVGTVEMADGPGGFEALTARRGVARTAAFAGTRGKREQLRLAIDHLHALADAAPPEVPLPAAAPFGAILVDRAACTLCFGCASVCPAGAVLAGGDRPQLAFVEQRCLQCGLCARACPEDAIELRPRYDFDREARARRRVLMEDAPFHCVSCGKVFGTTRTIERMHEKLAGHWMYQDKPEQLARLKMCEDCRVKDMFRGGGGLLDPHAGG